MGEKSEVRKVRRDKGIRLLTQRDVWVLHWIAEQSCVRFDQLQRLLSRQPQHRNQNAPGPAGLTYSAVDLVVTRWMQDPALVHYKRSYVGQPGWIWLTTHAKQIFDLCFEDSSHQWCERDFACRYVINQIRLYCEEQYPKAIWKSERQLQQKPMGVLAAGELWLAPDRCVAIECAQQGQAIEEMAEIMTALLKRYQTIWYFGGMVQASEAQRSLSAEYGGCVHLIDINEALLS